MDYEKKYKEAFELMKDCIPDEDGLVHVRPCDIFPELAESEDDKKKRILHSISSKMSFHLRDIFTEEEFQCFNAWSYAWLEEKKESPNLYSGDIEVLKEVISAYENGTFPFLKEDRIRMAERLKAIRPTKAWKPSDLPHWKKSTLPNDNNTTGFNSDYFCHKGYIINYKELFEKLPKDD